MLCAQPLVQHVVLSAQHDSRSRFFFCVSSSKSAGRWPSAPQHLRHLVRCGHIACIVIGCAFADASRVGQWCLAVNFASLVCEWIPCGHAFAFHVLPTARDDVVVALLLILSVLQHVSWSCCGAYCDGGDDGERLTRSSRCRREVHLRVAALNPRQNLHVVCSSHQRGREMCGVAAVDEPETARGSETDASIFPGPMW